MEIAACSVDHDDHGKRSSSSASSASGADGPRRRLSRSDNYRAHGAVLALFSAESLA